MNTSIFFKCLPRTLAFLACLAFSATAQTTSKLTSSFITRGEQTLLEISVIGGRVTAPPQVPMNQGSALRIQDPGNGPQFKRDRNFSGPRFETTYQFIVTSYEMGRHTIPPIKVMVDNVETTTEPLELEVFNPDDLKWSEAELSGRTISYASTFRALEANPYENETTPVEIKIYVPEDMYVDDWGIPDLEREGLTAWRFQPAQMRSRVNLLGRPYISMAYPSTLTPTRAGAVSIGPAKVRLVTREVVQDPFPRQTTAEVYLTVAKLELQSRPLPAGAPEGFDNAVGKFHLTTSSATTEILEGDPITADLIVSGSGNLDTVRPPQLTDSEGWKVYGTTTDQRGDERRQMSGTTVFHQSMRPLTMKTEIPSFRLVYFDPKDGIYQTLLSNPIPLRMSPNKAASTVAGSAVQIMPVPVERMTDILALVNPAHLTIPSSPTLPFWTGHAIGALLTLILIVKAIWMRVGPKFRKSPLHEIRAREIQEIAKTPRNEAGQFLKSAGAFIERRLGTNHSPEIEAVLAERDSACFRQDDSGVVLAPKRRDEILRTLRRAALVCLFAIGLAGITSDARADEISHQAKEAYDAAKYDEALKLWFDAGKYEELSADTLYNIGNACYRSGSPGEAALYYRRALSRDSTHQEARQNLRFLERKYGAITVDRPEYQYALARISLTAWQWIFWTGAWMFVLALLLFPATRPGAKIRIAAFAALILGPLLLSAGVLGWRFYPNDSQFAPVAKQAVVIGDKVALHTDAARTSPEVIDAPPGSLCEIIRESGRWAYISFATKTRGWVPIESIAKVLPDSPPTPPKFRKPKAGGKTA